MASFTSVLNVYSDRLIPPQLRANAEVYRNAKRLVLLDFAFLVWVCVFAGLLVGLGSWRGGLITLWCVLPILISLCAINRGQSPILAGNLLCSSGWATLTAVCFVIGGATPPMIWYACLPLVAVLSCGVAWGVLWTIIPLATVAAFALLGAEGVTLPSDLSPHSVAIFEYAAIGGFLVCQLWVAAIRVGVEQRIHVALREANRRLSRARADMNALREGFGFSVEEWQTLKREKAALEYALAARIEVDDFDSGTARHSDPPRDEGEMSLDDILGLAQRGAGSARRS